MIAILDYDMGNVGSIQNMIKKIGGYDTVITRDNALLARADTFILPGVGSFDKGIENLEKYDLISVINNHVTEGKALLGICLGMQLLGNGSEEGNKTGLGLIDFSCKRFYFDDNARKVPHMGWDYTRIVNRQNPMCHSLDEIERYYYIHSYYAICKHQEDVLMTCDYGGEFVSAVNQGNIYGMQFHPEKSHKYGIKLLTNFLKENCSNA